MLYTITSPTGNSVTKELTADEVERLQADNYFTVTKEYTDPFSDQPLRVHIKQRPEECQSCSA
jgi:hypothetical protein